MKSWIHKLKSKSQHSLEPFVYTLILLPLEREHIAVFTGTQFYISTFFFPPLYIPRTRHSNQLNPKSGWPATAKRSMIRTSWFLKDLQMMMGNSLKSFYRRWHQIANNRAQRAEPSLCVQIHTGKETRIVWFLFSSRLETKDKSFK